jgi:hypothetical protein
MKDMNMGVCEKFEEKKWRVCRGVVCLALGKVVLGERVGRFILSCLSCLVLSGLVLS